jgi:hypothetical protein
MCYVFTGSEAWPSIYKMCGGVEQSPIALVSNESISNQSTDGSKIVFSPNYFRAINGNWSSDGYGSNAK